MKSTKGETKVKTNRLPHHYFDGQFIDRQKFYGTQKLN